ncbi:MAG TPA: ergothioneine biosynthesis protein EgtB [Isosphaeraceae bacterium]|nr:ergothioneine biosynthesis protein EgtB [Isosphaeraceae bacterium]
MATIIATEAPGLPSAPGPTLADRYRAVRRRSEGLCEPLEDEDYVLQSMPDASPPKWHLAHTSWFFETFVLSARPGHRPIDERYDFLFNSYYNAVGERIPRPRRGLLSRPTVGEVYRYRAAVDDRMLDLLDGPEGAWRPLASTIELGLHHEQQHQELILTDIKHAFGSNPLHPSYREGLARPPGRPAPPLRWIAYAERLKWVGHDGEGFAFDNEGPSHRVYLEPFRLASRLVTCGDYLDFIADGGYDRPEHWLSDGWAARQSHGWPAPLYWDGDGDSRSIFTLDGPRPLDPAEPVCHLSYYEADAFARWAGARLPTEAEWELAASDVPVAGNFVEDDRLHPLAAPPVEDADPTLSNVPCQLFGDVWEWTQSPYTPYPGFRPAAGALGEYNGKFMCNQLVLRGGSCASPRSHLRASYRNFFPPDARWQFSGLRLALDGAG